VAVEILHARPEADISDKISPDSSSLDRYIRRWICHPKQVYDSDRRYDAIWLKKHLLAEENAG
jgi:hypothetical protein